MSGVFISSFDGVDQLAPLLSEAQKKWRLAYNTLYSARALLSVGKEILAKESLHSQPHTVIDEEPNHNSSIVDSSFDGVDQLAPFLSKAQKKWRLAYKTLYSVRALHSVCKEILAKESLRSQPHTAIDGVEQLTCKEIIPKEFVLTQPHTTIDVEPNKCDQSSLSQLIKERNIDRLSQFGGVARVVADLQTNAHNGIPGDAEDIASRHKSFGSNSYRKPRAKSIPMVMAVIMEAFTDPIILILLVFAALSLGFGIKMHGLKGCFDGGSIFAAILLEVAVSAFIKIWTRKEFYKLSQARDNILVDVTRNGQKQQIQIFNVVVGDLVQLKVGDQVPADGLFLDGQPLQVDETSMTGESEPVEVNRALNPFLLSGTKVVDGNAQMLVTSVGMNTEWGQIMRSITGDFDEKTPLQAKLKKLTMFMAKVGVLVAFLVLVILLTRYFTGHIHADNGSREFMGDKTSIHAVVKAVMGIIITPVLIAAASIPEGLLSAFKVTLAYSTRRMRHNQALVRKLSACEEMGKVTVTVICTNKKGFLTMEDMKVTKFWIDWKYIEEGNSYSIAPNVLELLHQGVGLNETQHPSGFMSRLSDKAVHEWGIKEMGMTMEELNKSCDILHIEEADSSKKRRNRVFIRKKADKTIHVHQKGEPEVILDMCSQYHDVTGVIKVIENGERVKLKQVIQDMATSGLQCIAFAHKQITQEDDYDGECLILLGVVGLNHQCQTGVRQAVKECQGAGVDVKMITADDMLTAKAVATECGIIETYQHITTGEVVEGTEFKNWTDEDRMQKVDRIRVIAKASPLEKLLMVQCLKKKGHVVAVTVDGTGDAIKAFKAADVGLYMGIQSTDMAKESSDIVILDNDFASVVKVLRWGRGIYINTQTYTQFHLTASIASLVIDFVTAISANEPPTINILASISAGKVPYATLQLIWVKLIMGTLAALALRIEQPTEDVMQKPPVSRSKPFITNIMWINMLAQAFYQITILLTVQFQGETIFSANSKVKDTMIFNTFVLLQVLMIFNVRKSQKNVVTGIQRKKLFWGVIGMIIVVQVMMVELLKRFADTERLSWGQWGACFGIAAASQLIGYLVKHIPVPENPFFSNLR